MATIEQAVDALKRLENNLGSSPSVAEVAEDMGVSSATAWTYLNKAAKEGKIYKSDDGKFMTLEVARAYKKGK